MKKSRPIMISTPASGVTADKIAPAAVDTRIGDQERLAAEPVRGRAAQDRSRSGAERRTRDQVTLGEAVQPVGNEV
jgi:hypothetical protein